MSYLQIPAPIDHQLYLSIQYLITLLNAEAATARKQAATWRDLRLKYDPNQPRIPAGRNNGGEWTDGGGSGAGRVSAPLPRRNPLQRGRHADNWWDDGRSRSTAPAQPPRYLPDDLRDSLKPIYPRPTAGQYVAEQARESITVENLAMTVAAATVPEAVVVGRLLTGTRQRVFSFQASSKSKDFSRQQERLKNSWAENRISLSSKKAATWSLLKTIYKSGSIYLNMAHQSKQGLTSRYSKELKGAGKEKWEDLGEHWYDFLDSRSFYKEGARMNWTWEADYEHPQSWTFEIEREMMRDIMNNTKVPSFFLRVFDAEGIQLFDYVQDELDIAQEQARKNGAFRWSAGRWSMKVQTRCHERACTRVAYTR